jgi:hypothetical protein
VTRAIARAPEDAGSLDLDCTADFEDSLTQEMQPGSPCPRGERSCSTTSICRESLSDTWTPDSGNHSRDITTRRLRNIANHGKRLQLSMMESNISFFQKNRRKPETIKMSKTKRPFPVADLSSPCPRLVVLIRRQALPQKYRIHANAYNLLYAIHFSSSPGA